MKDGRFVNCYFISDLHIKDINERNGVILLRFLNFLAEEKTDEEACLFLLGDIFDLWISDHAIFAIKFKSIVEAISRLKSVGYKIVYFEGNHDLHIEEYWTKFFGVEVYTEAHYFKIGSQTLRLEHGDLINQKDKAYLRLRKFVRSHWIETLGHNVPGGFWNYLGMRLSKKSRSLSSKYRLERNSELIQMIRNHAKVAFDQRPFDIIISGHMHVFDDYEFAWREHQLRSINLGSWLDSPNALTLIDGKMHWRKGDEFLKWIKL